jgi:DNA-binding MarR family transcriptional regulator
VAGETAASGRADGPVAGETAASGRAGGPVADDRAGGLVAGETAAGGRAGGLVAGDTAAGDTAAGDTAAGDTAAGETAAGGRAGGPVVLGLGTRLRHVLEVLDGDVAQVYADLGLAWYRPRFSPVVRALVALGPSSIRDIAHAIGVTHSAASQTVAQMSRCGLVEMEPGQDARQRIVRLTDLARSLRPVIDAEWAATSAAAGDLDTELPVPLGQMLTAVLTAVERRPMRERIAEAARALDDPALAPLQPPGDRG